MLPVLTQSLDSGGLRQILSFRFKYTHIFFSKVMNSRMNYFVSLCFPRSVMSKHIQPLYIYMKCPFCTHFIRLNTRQEKLYRISFCIMYDSINASFDSSNFQFSILTYFRQWIPNFIRDSMPTKMRRWRRSKKNRKLQSKTNKRCAVMNSDI